MPKLKTKKKIRIPSCSVCQTPYDDDSRAPLLLQCGHCFCKLCLSHMFSSSSALPKPTLPCPKCRHVSTFGNSVLSLPKNYSLLPILSQDDDLSDEDDSESESESVPAPAPAPAPPGSSRCRGGGGTGLSKSLCSDHEMRLIKRIGEASADGSERWLGELRTSRCRHKVMVKKVEIGDLADSDWAEGELERLRLSSMWCRNVCAFHGVMRQDDGLCLVMERCYGSVQAEMQRSGGRLTLEQILRYKSSISP